MRICVIFNPAAKGDKAKRFRRRIEGIASRCALKPTMAPGEGSALAAEAVREGFDVVAAAGGDGTVNEVVNGIASEPDGLARVRLGVLPTGTMNVFAREMGISLKVERAWDTILKGRETRIDLPRIEFQRDGMTVTRHFAQLAGAGLDARAVEMVDRDLKRSYGPFAYFMAGIRALRSPPSQITARWNGSSAKGQLVIVGNGRLYGGTFPLHPRASLDDGKLDVVVFPEITWFVAARFVWGYVARRTVPMRKESAFQADSVILEGAGVPLELDGESAGRLPGKCSVMRKALRVIVPAAR